MLKTQKIARKKTIDSEGNEPAPQIHKDDAMPLQHLLIYYIAHKLEYNVLKKTLKPLLPLLEVDLE